MSALTGTMFARGWGLRTQMEKFYSSSVKHLLDENPDGVILAVKLSVAVLPIFSDPENNSPLKRDEVFYEGLVSRCTEIPTPLLPHAHKDYLFRKQNSLKDEVLLSLVELWYDNIEQKVNSMPKEMVENDKKYNFHYVGVRGVIDFTVLQSDGTTSVKSYSDDEYPPGRKQYHFRDIPFYIQVAL